METRNRKQSAPETSVHTTSKDPKLGLMPPISEHSKPIRKTSGEAYITKLYRKNPGVFDEYMRLRQVVKAANQEKAAAVKRFETLFGSCAAFLDIESACEESVTEDENN